MAKVQRLDRGLGSRLDEFEKRMFILKIEYEKYFSGLESIEPVRERDDMKRALRDIIAELTSVKNTAQQYRINTLRARFSSLDLYLTRNLVMVERGTHPRMKFRADLHDRQRGVESGEAEKSAPKPRPLTPQEREEAGYREIYEKYVKTRAECGQAGDLTYESVRDVLQKQTRTIKSRFGVEQVRFRVTVEEGKAKVKAVPVT